jgi:hypothetical protein
MLDEPAGAGTLAEAVKSRDWDKGWDYTGMGQYGASLSELDSLIIALGRTRSEQALGPILEKVKQLDAGSEFSHCRAVAISLETLGDTAAAKPLAEFLKKPGITGHAFTNIDAARRRTPPGSEDTLTRNLSLRELVLARALYRCGDYEGIGKKILREYARDLRGHYARHARAVLQEKPSAISKVESISASLQILEPIRKKYEGKIIPGNTDKDYPRYASAMEELLNEWNPIGHTAEEVEFIIGAPPEIIKGDLMYRFEDGFSGVAWLFKLKDGNVIEVQQLSID